MGGQASYDRFATPYNISRIFNLENMSFDLDAYNEYSALYLPGPYAMVYLLAFAGMFHLFPLRKRFGLFWWIVSSCLLVHTALYHGQAIINGIKKLEIEEEDIHRKLMRRYPEVPNGWYYSLAATFFIIAIIAVEIWPTNMPVWALVLSILLPAVYMLPCGFIYAVTGQGLAINLLAEIIPGALLSGQPLPNMVSAIGLGRVYMHI